MADIYDIRLTKGDEINLPSEAPLGKPLYATDTNVLYIGQGTGVKPKRLNKVKIASMDEFPRLSTEVSDEPRIERALSYCVNKNIKFLHFNYVSGNYRTRKRFLMQGINDLTIIADPNVKIQFDDNVPTAHYQNMLIIEMIDCTNITFDGVKFFGNKVGQTSPHASATAYYNGMIISGSENITIRNCSFDSFFGIGIIFRNKDWYTLSTNDYTIMSQYKGVHGANIHNNRSFETRAFVQFACADTKNIKVTNNYIDTNSEHGIVFYPYIKNILVSGNTIKDCVDVGIRGYENENVVITDNLIDGYGVCGIDCDTNEYTRICKYVTIANNVVKNWSSGRTSTPKGIEVIARYATVTGNVLENVNHTGIGATGDFININGNIINQFTSYGIQVGHRTQSSITNDRIVIVGNNLSGTGTAIAGTTGLAKVQVANNIT